MMQLIGLSHLANKELLLLALIGTCASFAVGWIMHLIMRQVGFGIFGNTFICGLGILTGLFLYNRFYGRLTSPDIVMVLTFVTVAVMTLLVTLSITRRVLKL
jgi:uncharacterized membrane protein YeaQ/YmgE (transglycosylase-associated protein family)